MPGALNIIWILDADILRYIKPALHKAKSLRRRYGKIATQRELALRPNLFHTVTNAAKERGPVAGTGSRIY